MLPVWRPRGFERRCEQYGCCLYARRKKLSALAYIAVMVLVANKVDLAEERQVPTEQATEYAERYASRLHLSVTTSSSAG